MIEFLELKMSLVGPVGKPLLGEKSRTAVFFGVLMTHPLKKKKKSHNLRQIFISKAFVECLYLEYCSPYIVILSSELHIFPDHCLCVAYLQ